MTLFDVNILVYAHREDVKDHRFYRGKLEAFIGTGEPFGLTNMVGGGFVRVVTQPKFPKGPTPLPRALAVVEELMGNRNAHWVSAGRRHWELFAMLCRQTSSRGKLVADAQHAAVALEQSARWVSSDKDFHRFEPHGLRFERWAPDID